MALPPINEAHALQIQAGATGRHSGHAFENALVGAINGFRYPIQVVGSAVPHLSTGDPALSLLKYIANRLHLTSIQRASAVSTGSLATSEMGKRWLVVNGVTVSRCKSDLIVTLHPVHGAPITVGVSIKQCNNRAPTNAQLYFTTARGFVNLLRNNQVPISDQALHALRQFCGDDGFRPSNNALLSAVRKVDPRRYFWEETDDVGLKEWSRIFTTHQDKITRLLLQKAYMDDPFVPDFLLHKTKSAPSWNTTETAIYSMEELIVLSRRYQGFATRSYSVRKGSYRDPAGVEHLAPRFGIVQMQRGGQTQHPEQLQFNLEAGYFYKIQGRSE
ncbi:hypothetical protein ACFPME_05895 [Rhodanobacter umsongensis]|uniref:Uncharacterized protein n=1 Tax=Rhodanobacter umsongensis TaxID=633153 RepID=A0ABW0JJ34_9GAMM